MKKWSQIWQNYKMNSIGFQLLSRITIIMTGLFILAGALNFVMMQQYLYNKKVNTIQDHVHSIPSETWEQWREGKIEEHASTTEIGAFLSEVDSIVFIDRNNHISNLYVDSHFKQEVPRFSRKEYEEFYGNQQKPFQVIENESGKVQMVIFTRVGSEHSQQGIIQASVDLTETHDMQVNILNIFIIGSMIAMIVGLITLRPVLRRSLSPLSQVVDRVDQIHADNLSERLPYRKESTEIERLTLSFNGMLKRIETSFTAEKEAKEQMRRFIADASHELRTPLTSIHGFLEVLLLGAAENPDQLQKALNSMYGETERLNKLVSDLLMLARLDHSPEIHMRIGNLRELIYDMEPQLRLIAGTRQVQIEITDDVVIPFASDKMKQVILNLFQNAVQHTDSEKGMIRVSLDTNAHSSLLSIQDNGNGIEEIHIPHLFERFYRGDSSRARQHGGAGLGLAIVKSIVDLHGGDLKVESKKGEGALFKILFPIG